MAEWGSDEFKHIPTEHLEDAIFLYASELGYQWPTQTPVKPVARKVETPAPRDPAPFKKFPFWVPPSKLPGQQVRSLVSRLASPRKPEVSDISAKPSDCMNCTFRPSISEFAKKLPKPSFWSRMPQMVESAGKRHYCARLFPPSPPSSAPGTPCGGGGSGACGSSPLRSSRGRRRHSHEGGFDFLSRMILDLAARRAREGVNATTPPEYPFRPQTKKAGDDQSDSDDEDQNKWHEFVDRMLSDVRERRKRREPSDPPVAAECTFRPTLTHRSMALAFGAGRRGNIVERLSSDTSERHERCATPPDISHPFKPEIHVTPKTLKRARKADVITRLRDDIKRRQQEEAERKSEWEAEVRRNHPLTSPDSPFAPLSRTSKQLMLSIEQPFLQRVEEDMIKRQQTAHSLPRELVKDCTFSPKTNWVWTRTDPDTGEAVEISEKEALVNPRQLVQRLSTDAQRRQHNILARARHFGSMTERERAMLESVRSGGVREYCTDKFTWDEIASRHVGR